MTFSPKFFYLLLFSFFFLSSKSNAQDSNWSAKYDLVFPFSEGLAVVRKDGLFGYVDKNGKEVIQTEWVKATYFSEGIASVGKEIEGRIYNGCIDKTGTVIIDFKYNYIDPFKNGVARVRFQDEDDSWGLVDKNGKELVSEGKYRYIGLFYENRAEVGLIDADLGGYIDQSGKEVIKATLGRLWGDNTFQKGLAKVLKEGKEVFIDTTGKTVLDKELYESSGLFRNGLVAVQKNGLWGFMDLEKNLIIDFQYKVVWGFSETGYCWVQTDAGWGTINKKGETIIKPQYKVAFASKFSSNVFPSPCSMASVTNDGELPEVFKKSFKAKWALVNADGKQLSGFEYDHPAIIQDSLICISKNKLFGLFNLSGKTIIPFLLDDVKIGETRFLDRQGLFEAKIDTIWYYFDSDGNRLGKIR